MSRPTLLVMVLLVLWLIVLVPMIFRRVDEGAQGRSVRRFGRSMKLLNRRHAKTSALTSSTFAGGRYPEVDEVSFVAPRIAGPRDELFVPGSGRQRTQMNGEDGRRSASVGQEGQMYRGEMSDARRQMMARRRRSLTILIAGSVISLMLTILVGGALFALAAIVFCLGLGGYTYFLRTQALRDRERRAWREERSHERAPQQYEVEQDEEYFDSAELPEIPETMVRIDDDHIDLHNLDTMDLTGVYNEADYRDYRDLRERRAS
jgi:hypothetical protein